MCQTDSMYELSMVLYELSNSIHFPILRTVFFHSLAKCNTFERQNSLNFVTPMRSISFLSASSSSFSAMFSMGSPWQSHPHLRSTRWPFMVQYLQNKSLLVKLKMCP